MLKIPDTITEAEVLALIEGDMGTLPHERREIVRQAVAADPVLSRLVGEIRTDAKAVVSFSHVTAPPSIRMKVVEELRRPAARPEPIREPAGGEIPVSSVVVSRERPWRRMIERAPVRRFAAAAALLIAAGAGVWLVGQAIEYGKIHAAPRTVALGPSERETDGNRSAGDGLLADDHGAAIAAATPNSDNQVPATTDEGDPPIPAGPEGTAIASATGPVDETSGMDLAKAVELARAGRLVIRVRAVSEREAESDIERLATETARDIRWRPLEARDLPQVALALRQRPMRPLPYAAERPPRPVTPVGIPDVSAPVASPLTPVGTAADVAEALKQADFRPLYTVELDESETNLATLVQNLSKSKSHIAEFVSLEEPLPTLIPSTDPAAVLWWTRPPSGWTRRVCVPIVLETAR
jgi:hypothetical protein